MSASTHSSAVGDPAVSKTRPNPAPHRLFACLSGCRAEPCPTCMHIIYIVVTALAAILVGCAATLNFGGARSVKATADRLRISQRWMVPFGILLASGAIGLLGGMAVPLLGTAAAIGLVLYFVGALVAHLRVHDGSIAGALFFLFLAVAALVASVAYRGL